MKGMKPMLQRVSSIPLQFALIAALIPAAPLFAARDYGVTSVHQPVVRRVEYSLDVAADITPGSTEDRRLADWLEALTPVYGDQVALDLGGRAMPGHLPQILHARLAKFGLVEAPILPVSVTPIPSDRVRITLRRSVASVPGCPNYRGVGGADFGNSGIRGYGCAVNGNIASMIADPNDLLEGKVSPPGEGWRAAKDAADAKSIGADSKLAPTDTGTLGAPLGATPHD